MACFTQLQGYKQALLTSPPDGEVGNLVSSGPFPHRCRIGSVQTQPATSVKEVHILYFVSDGDQVSVVLSAIVLCLTPCILSVVPYVFCMSQAWPLTTHRWKQEQQRDKNADFHHCDGFPYTCSHMYSFIQIIIIFLIERSWSVYKLICCNCGFKS